MQRNQGLFPYGSAAKQSLTTAFPYGWAAGRSLTIPFPYGWAAGRRGAIYNVLEIRF